MPLFDYPIERLLHLSFDRYHAVTTRRLYKCHKVCLAWVSPTAEFHLSFEETLNELCIPKKVAGVENLTDR